MKVLATAVLFAKWMGFLGLMCGILYSVGGFFVDLFTTGLNWGTAMAFMALAGMPVIFGCFGFFMGAVVASAWAALRSLPRQGDL